MINTLFRSSSRVRLGAACALALALGAAPVLLAHEGEDHADDSAATVSAAAGARTVTELTSELYEALVESHGDHLDIYLDRFDTNAPVVGAKLTLSIDDGAPVPAEEETPGQYMVEIKPLAPGSAVTLTLAVSSPAGEDLLGGTLAAAGDPERAIGSRFAGWLVSQWPWVLAALLVGGAVVARQWYRASRRRSRALPASLAAVSAPLLAGLGLAALGALAMGSAPLAAHEGHDHAEETVPAVAGGNRPTRLPDGSVFVPKPTQRIIELRTQIAVEGPTPLSIRLAGEIVGDPRASALLQTLQGGRVGAAGGQWPVLGARVRRGQVLLRLTPSGSGGERASTAADGARIQAELQQAEAELARLEGLPGIVSRAEVEAARSRLQSLRAQRVALSGPTGAGEAIVAPIDGVIASIDARPGAVVAPGESLISLIDPARLSVEALAFEPIGAGGPAAITRASVALRDGTRLEARVEGVGSQLKGGAISVRLNLTSVAPGLAVGQPVVVYLKRAITTPGLPLPVEALVRTPNGDRVVFEKISAERFLPRTVQVRQVSAERIVVLAGLKADARVVVSGAALVAQIR